MICEKAKAEEKNGAIECKGHRKEIFAQNSPEHLVPRQKGQSPRQGENWYRYREGNRSALEVLQQDELARTTRPQIAHDDQSSDKPNLNTKANIRRYLSNRK